MSEPYQTRKRLILSLALIGMVVASLAGLSHHLEWLASLCSGFGDGCRETAEYNLFSVPVWVWGVIFYLLVSLLLLRFRDLFFWVLAAGLGMELGLMWIMFSTKTVCVFCLANVVVITALVLCSFEKARVWQTLALTLAVFIFSNVLISRENGNLSAANEQGTPALAAKVAGQSITVDELVQPMASRVYDLQEQIYRLERDRLDSLVAKMLLEKEAEKQGKPLPELVKEFAATQAISVGDQEVDNYYAENRSRWTDWKGSEQDLMTQIRAYLQQQKMQQRILEYARSLGPKYGLEVYLKEPRSPTIQISIGKDDPVFGPEKAPLTIVEFSDYQCPACRRNHEVVQELRQAYKDRVKWVFKDFPMPGHKWAKGAALAARCAAEQGKFWQYQDLLFSSPEELSPDRLTQLARELGLQVERFSECVETAKFQPSIEKDIEEGKKFGLNTTPTFIINNRLLPGAPPSDRFKQIIDEELEKAGKHG
jgi:protein-disulfide isomerase